jgi:hypothetical protein
MLLSISSNIHILSQFSTILEKDFENGLIRQNCDTLVCFRPMRLGLIELMFEIPSFGSFQVATTNIEHRKMFIICR